MALTAITPHIEDVDNFLSHCHRKSYPNRSTIIYEGDKCDTRYYIIKGSDSVVLEDDEDKEIVITYLNPGDFFGEMGLFAKAEELSAWCRAGNACEVAKISYASSIPAYAHTLRSCSPSVSRWRIVCAKRHVK
jgi:CRP/FNR family cyclic AMP-dependent transcriptional regulator